MHSHWLPCERQVRERWATASTAEGVEIFPPLPVLSFLIKSPSSHTSTFSHFLSYSFLFLLHRYLLVSGCLACAKIMSSLTPSAPFLPHFHPPVLFRFLIFVSKRYLERLELAWKNRQGWSCRTRLSREQSRTQESVIQQGSAAHRVPAVVAAASSLPLKWGISWKLHNLCF